MSIFFHLSEANWVHLVIIGPIKGQYKPRNDLRGLKSAGKWEWYVSALKDVRVASRCDDLMEPF